VCFLRSIVFFCSLTNHFLLNKVPSYIEYGGESPFVLQFLVRISPKHLVTTGICANGTVSPGCLCDPNPDPSSGIYYQPSCFVNGHTYAFVSAPGITYSAAKTAAAGFEGFASYQSVLDDSLFSFSVGLLQSVLTN